MNNTDKYNEFIAQLQLVHKYLADTEKSINEIIKSVGENTCCNKVSLGDVVMKDYSVLSPEQAKCKKRRCLRYSISG